MGTIMMLLAALIFAAPDATTQDLLRRSQFTAVQERLLEKRGTGDWDLADQMTLAAACLGQGDLDCAELLYNELLHPEPRTALAFFGLAEVARLRGDRDGAFTTYRAYLASSAPGRTSAYDDLATSRLAMLVGGPTGALAGRRPTFQELSWAASRWSSFAFFPAIAAGALTGAIASELNMDVGAALIGFSTAVAVFGGSVGYGIHRQAVGSGYRGNMVSTAVVAGLGPVVAVGAMFFALDNAGIDGDVAGLFGSMAAVGSVIVVAPLVYSLGMEPIGDETEDQAVPSVVNP